MIIAGSEPAVAFKERFPGTAHAHGRCQEIMARQEAVGGVFNADAPGCILGIEFQRETALAGHGHDQEIGMGYGNAFFFFKMPELAEGKKTTNSLDVLGAGIKGPFIE